MKMMKGKWLHKICTYCIALAGVLHWNGISMFLFGEAKYPSEPEK